MAAFVNFYLDLDKIYIHDLFQWGGLSVIVGKLWEFFTREDRQIRL